MTHFEFFIKNQRKFNEDYITDVMTSYLAGTRDKEEYNEHLFKNRIIKINGNYWQQYNYGAVCAKDYDFGGHAAGFLMSYEEAINLSYLRLPSKDEFIKLIQAYRIIGYANISNGVYFNSRILINNLSFYYIRNYSVDLYKDLREKGCDYFMHIWLNDSYEDKALTVKIGISKHNIYGDIVEITEPIFEYVLKNEKINAHFIVDPSKK